LEASARHCWIYRVSKYTTYINVLKHSIDWGRGVVRDIIEIYLRDESQIDRIVEELEGGEYTLSVRVLARYEDIVLLDITNRICPLYYMLKSGTTSFIREDIKPNGIHRFRIRVKNREELDRIKNRLVETLGDLDIKNIKISLSRPLLTKKQEVIIKTALDMGYYDVPKRVTINDLAKIFNLTPATLMEILRRGEKNIIEAYFRRYRRRLTS